MPRKPNYRFERNERTRAREAKREEKLKRRQQERAPNRTEDEAEPPEAMAESPEK